MACAEQEDLKNKMGDQLAEKLNIGDIEKIVKRALDRGKKALVETDAKELLSLVSVPVPRYKMVTDIDSAKAAANEIGYPVALKVVSSDILHKSEVGGISLDLKEERDIADYWTMMVLNVADDCPLALIEGFLVEEMMPKGATEVIVGAIEDPQFGPVVMFGTGGVSVELMQDVSFRLAPVTKQEALEMMREVKGFPLLTGYRGSGYKDIDAVADVIVTVSNLVGSSTGIKEMEINPLMVYRDKVVAVDVKCVIA